MPPPPHPLPVRLVLGIFLGVVLLQLPIGALIHGVSFSWGIFVNEAVVFLVLPFAVLEMSGHPVRAALPLGKAPEQRILLALVMTIASAVLLAYFENTGARLLPVPEFLARRQVQAVAISSAFDILVLVILLCLLAPVCEEVLFRGIIQHAIARRRGRWVGIFLSAIFFALIHSTSFTPYLYLLLGLLFAWVFDVTGSLRAVILCHVINNSWILTNRIHGLGVPLSRPFGTADYLLLGAAGATVLVCIRCLERRRRLRPQVLVSD